MTPKERETLEYMLSLESRRTCVDDEKVAALLAALYRPAPPDDLVVRLVAALQGFMDGECHCGDDGVISPCVQCVGRQALALAAPAPIAPPDDLVSLVRELRDSTEAALTPSTDCPAGLTLRQWNAVRALLAWAAPAPVVADDSHHYNDDGTMTEPLPAPVAAPAHVSVSQGAALAAALDALESDATTDQRREAWDRLRDEFYPVAAPAPETRRCGCGPSDVCRDDGCQCACHQPAPETPRTSYIERACGCVHDSQQCRVVPPHSVAPETPAPDAMLPYTNDGHLLFKRGGCVSWCPQCRKEAQP